VRQQYQYVDKSSGVGVLDKAVGVLESVAGAPRSLAELVAATGLPRPTAHRLAQSLELHGLLLRDPDGRYVLGPTLARWTAGSDPFRDRADQAVRDLRDSTGLSAQVYRRVGDQRLCIAAAEPTSGLRDTVPVGTLLTMRAGSAAQVLIAWTSDYDRRALMPDAAFTAADLASVRRRGWAHSLGQREPGVGSVSMPVRGANDDVVAAVSISGPVDRLQRPGSAMRAALAEAARELAASLT
jgi:DNA-binding IclR family transcriptional regulator